MTAPFTLAPLPWEENALEPVISARTIGFHYHKHHATYVKTLNELVAKTKFADMKLEEIIRATADAMDDSEKKIFNNAGQVWNHDFYWRSLSPVKTEASGKLASAITRDFGGTAELIAALAEAGDLTQAGTVAVQGSWFDLCRGVRPGRQSTGEITLFKSVGSAIEDLAAAGVVYQPPR